MREESRGERAAGTALLKGLPWGRDTPVSQVTVPCLSIRWHT